MELDPILRSKADLLLQGALARAGNEVVQVLVYLAAVQFAARNSVELESPEGPSLRMPGPRRRGGTAPTGRQRLDGDLCAARVGAASGL